ncbi:alpha/beta hydrolase fold domain-containing protein [Chitinophaga sp. SYP-B3965]|uniref:alpha/beta hydrolase n=1 Tax=Chitinophaga sp. SYP-B3965 TaxID=2663120 RepID=UPI001299CA72|nr:alpha/beta hydrolase fold domain-containing protein [Chitinophaga sp. SYP-B3965]MRG44380.1 alpha/beta hydrolase fold domain-containing protein [Chitinophaga sp. SYP-B3965]
MKQLLLLLLLPCFTLGQDYTTKENIHYYTKSTDSYMDQQCVLDVYYPTNIKNAPTVVWFHGGGITGGDKEIPAALKGKGLVIIGVKYRLSPKVKAPAYIEDAAAAIAWTFKHVAAYNGDTNRIFISGHSAGAYLGAMVTLNKEYLARYQIDANRIAGLISMSAQAITHFTIRQEQGIKDIQPTIDKYAPLFHVRADAPPVLLITGDREMEMLGRYEENAYWARMMKLAGHKQTTLYELQGFGHNMTAPAFPLLLKFIAEKR